MVIPWYLTWYFYYLLYHNVYIVLTQRIHSYNSSHDGIYHSVQTWNYCGTMSIKHTMVILNLQKRLKIIYLCIKEREHVFEHHAHAFCHSAKNHVSSEKSESFPVIVAVEKDYGWNRTGTEEVWKRGENGGASKKAMSQLPTRLRHYSLA